MERIFGAMGKVIAEKLQLTAVLADLDREFFKKNGREEDENSGRDNM